MCDESQLDAMQAKTKGGINRRSFTAIGGAAFIAGCSGAPEASSQTPDGEAAGASVIATPVSITTDAGTADGVFYHPAQGSYPAVILWPDIAGVRPASKAMSERLANEGYAVLHMNPYYRDVAGTQFEDFPAFIEGQGFEAVKPWREKLTPEAIMADSKSYVAWLDEQDAVDSAKGIGANGYCMSGSYTFYAAHAVPERVKAAASLHGGGLVTDAPTSPHKIMQPGTAYFVGIAKNDDEKEPEAKTALKEAAEAAGVSAEVEVYGGDHGWTVLDSPAYEEGEAERAWSRMLALFSGL